MSVDLFFSRFRAYGSAPAFITAAGIVNYSDFLKLICDTDTDTDSITVVEGLPSPESYARLFASLKNNNVVVPILSTLPDAEKENKKRIAGENKSARPLYKNLERGLVLFSSGSGGEAKALVHDFDRLAKRFAKAKTPRRLLQFLLFDHIGGLNTTFSALNDGGCLVLPEKKDPASVLQTLRENNVEVFPTSPSFLQWLLLSQELERTSLPELKIITYGTEPMPESTLQTLKQKLPHVKFKQTYGLSEVGILSTQSRADDSTWMRLKDSMRIRNGLLEIKTETSMLGYLNAESPFTEDGWFQTFDAVETDGEWLKILGRQSDLINIGGVKVAPAEVENVLLEMPEVADATVYGETNPLLGEIVKAQVRLNAPIALSDFRIRMRLYCSQRLEPCKIPQDVQILDSATSPTIGKKRRHPTFSPF